ncbi:MAG TPA: metal ABC transporter permease [Gemmatimonadales bacterium]|nr:metal ABC transporter permease [Gemmatimonadales bacterium]
MSPAQAEIQLIAVLTAVACALPGTFLVLRRMAMLSDAISHAILLGIVAGFFLTGDLASPLLVVGAALTGLVTVAGVELLQRTRLVREDAATGLVFPVLFSVGVILVSRYAGSVHLDTDSVLLGELAFAPFDRFVVAGRDLGPRGLWLIGAILAVDLLVIGLLWKELALSTFDPALTAALGFSPVALTYVLMGLVSVTAVGAFDVVGSILVVALMVAPPAAAWLLTDRLPRMLGLAAGFGAASAVAGYWTAHLLDVSIAGAMASMAGLVFAGASMVAPERGVLAVVRRRARQQREFAETLLAMHLQTHEGRPEAAEECSLETLHRHLRWTRERTLATAARMRRRGLVEEGGGLLRLTDDGRRRAAEALQR